MPDLLIWIALPLLAAPFFTARERVAASAGRLILVGFGVAALRQGAGTLDPRNLHTIVAQSSHDAWFVGITAGATIAGGCLLPALRDWRATVLGVPLAVVLLLASLPAIVPLLVGATIGSIPYLAARVFAFRPKPAVAQTELVKRPRISAAPSMVLLLLALVCGVVGPAVASLVALAMLCWTEWRRTDARRLPWLPALATACIAGWIWLAVTIAGDPLVGLLHFGMDAPVSDAASRTLALLAIGWAAAIAAPWPLSRWNGTVMLLPVVAVLGHLATVHATPEGIAHWQPVLSTVLVLSALAAAAFGRWDGAAGALTLLTATRPGVLAFVAAIVLAVVPAVRRHVPMPDRARALAAGVSVALLVTVLLRDQVLLAVVLALGLATVANRIDRVALISGTRHL